MATARRQVKNYSSVGRKGRDGKEAQLISVFSNLVFVVESISRIATYVIFTVVVALIYWAEEIEVDQSGYHGTSDCNTRLRGQWAVGICKSFKIPFLNTSKFSKIPRL
jgi:hypothetical protein